jgi:hypothetical protein
MLSARSFLVLLCSSVFACGGGEVPTGGGGSAPGDGGNGGDPVVGGNGGTPDGGGGTAPIGGEGTGGSGGSEEPWPDCETQPDGSPTKTLSAIWSDDPSDPAEAWVPGVYVTAVSKNGCVAGEACQIYVQQDESYASIAAATHQSLRVGIAPAVASYFTDVAVNDRIDLYAHAVRDTEDGQNELFFLVSPGLPGCAKVVGTGTTAPLAVTLDDLTVAAYEDTVGPMLVQLNAVSGNPNLADETFALWATGSKGGGDITTVTSASPFFLPGAAFTGLSDGVNTDFLYVIGVFGVYAPDAEPLVKYEEVYVRSVADYPLLP